MKFLFAFATAALLLIACNKEKQADAVCFDGVVRYAGDPTADGLGWVIYKDDSTTTKPYVPQSLPDEFKVNNLKVAACLQPTDERVSCRCTEPLYKHRISSIQRR